jgi:ABC-type enterochelin transport system permease subunit
MDSDIEQNQKKIDVCYLAVSAYQFRKILALELWMFKSFVIRLMFANLAQLIQIILDPNSFLHQLKKVE